MIEQKPFRVLSLDGGGMRGIYTAQYLASLADSFCKKRGCTTLDIGAGFDLIVGTSTGAILACALAANIPLSKVVAFYAKRGAAIFERRVPTNIGFALLHDLRARSKALKRGEAALRLALEECFGQETVGEVYKRRGIALGITAVDMSTHRSWVFKTPHLSGSNHRDDPFTLVELCLASSAAPIYRSLAQMPAHDGSSGSHVFADGGLWANNPVLIGMIDALEMSTPGQSIEIYSIGTVPRPAGDDMSNEVMHRGLLEWRFGAEAASLAIDAQEFAYHNMARMLAKHLDRPCAIVRFPRESVPAKMMQYLDLDEVRQDALQQTINLARNDVNMTNSRCNDPNDVEAGLISRLFNGLDEQTDPNFVDASQGDWQMIDCSKEMNGFHKDEVTLPSTARTQMRDHRDANRKRLRAGLTKAENPLPKNFHSQGSYAMKTMVQHDDNKYDIDDGVYFDKDQLVGERGGEMTALATRQMVRDAVDDGCFAKAPEVRKNCVRVFYQAGYHVDLPVYRKIEEVDWLGSSKVYYELASATWKRSDARDVTRWFEEQNERLSPSGDEDQMRRICRFIKKFSTSRTSWCSQTTSGFVITKLVTEKFKPVKLRDDESLRDTMKTIRDRLKWSLEVTHPVTPNETLSKGSDDSKIAFLRDRLSDAISWLEPLEKSDCSRSEARDAWDKVFNTDYFANCEDIAETDSVAKSAGWATAASILGSISAEAAGAKPVNKSGSNRYA